MISCPLAHWTKRTPSALAINDLTYKEVDQLVWKIADSLLEIPNEIISFTPQLTIESIALFIAAWRTGKSIYPINPKIPYLELQRKVQETQSYFVDVNELVKSKGSKEKKNTAIISMPIRIATLFETSSGGKITCHSLQSHLVSAKSACIFLGITQDDTYLVNLPLFHVAGMASFLRPFLVGARVVLPPNEKQATHISMVPTQLYRYLQTGDSYPKLKCLLVGGAPLSTTLMQEAHQKGVPLFVSYGMTETASLAILKTPNGKTFPLPHIEMTLSHDGELLLRGPSLFSHYFKQKLRQPKDWFATKDLAKFEAGNTIHILGRKDRQFICGGENIQPEEIEEALLSCERIIEAKIIAHPDPEYGMVPHAQVVTHGSITEEEILKKLQKRLLPFKFPRKIEFLDPGIDAKLSKMGQ